MTGVLIFFIIMSVILFITRVIALKYYEKLNPETKIIEESNVSSSIAQSVSNEIDESELIAVISAAAFQMLNQKVKVKKIQFLSNNDSSAWSRAGRLNIMSSHSVKH